MRSVLHIASLCAALWGPEAPTLLKRRASFYFCSGLDVSPGSAFLTRQKGTKKRPKGLPLWEPLYGKGLCGPYPQWRQAAVRVRPTGHVPPANAAKQVGRKYVWRHLPLPVVGVPVGSTLQTSSTNRLAASPSG